MLEFSILSFDFSPTAHYIAVGALLHAFFVVLFLVNIIIIDKKNLHCGYRYWSLKVLPDDPVCPLAGLKSFPTEGIIKKIVDHINLLVDLMMMEPEIEECMKKHQRRVFNLWEPLTVDTHRCYCYFMMVINKP